MEELHAAFLPRFLEIARTRVTRALAAVAEGGDATTVVRDLHALAGEAGLLGLSDLLPLARDGEDKARGVLAARNDQTMTALKGALEELAKAIEQLGNHQPGRAP